MTESVTGAAAATVWLADGRTVADEALAACFDWLNPDEKIRYAGFVRPERQRQFLLGRVLLRLALSRLLAVSPAGIFLTERAGFAPRLHCTGPAPGFSLSHSGAWVACAISADCALGLDIEILDATRDFGGLAGQAFSADELVWFDAQPPAQRVAAFYQLWSRKEANFKLDSVTGASVNACCVSIVDPALSIVLCSARSAAVVLVHDALTALSTVTHNFISTANPTNPASAV